MRRICFTGSTVAGTVGWGSLLEKCSKHIGLHFIEEMLYLEILVQLDFSIARGQSNFGIVFESSRDATFEAGSFDHGFEQGGIAFF